MEGGVSEVGVWEVSYLGGGYFLNMFRNRKSWVSSERSASCGFVCMMRRLSASGSAIVFCFPSGPVGVARCCWLGEGGGG